MELPTAYLAQRAVPCIVSLMSPHHSFEAHGRVDLFRTAEEIVKLLTADLRLTTAYLQVHPKVYWIWSHRKWCLESVPLGPEGSEGWRNEFWKMELMLIEKMLDVDARNCKLTLEPTGRNTLTKGAKSMRGTTVVM
jgi:hypothetical protein